MVTKNIILTVLAILVALSIPASRQLITEIAADTAPESSVEALAAIAETQPITETAQPAIAVAAPLAVAGKGSFAIVPQTVASKSVSKAVSEPAVLVSEQPKTVAVPENEPETLVAAKPEILIGVPKIVKLPGTSNGFLVSQWLNVPADVAGRLKTLPVPAVPKPRMRAFPLVDTVRSRFATTVSKRELMPLIPRALMLMPAAGRVSLNENTRARNFEPVVARRMLPQIPEPAVAKPVHRSFSLSETTAAKVSSTLATRRLTPLLPVLTIRSFELTPTIAANTALAPTLRMPMPFLPEPVIAKPTVRAFSLTEMTSVTIVSAPISTRELSPLTPQPERFVQKPVIRSFGNAETTTAVNVSSQIVRRDLMPRLPGSILSRHVLPETASTFVATALRGRDLQKLPEPPTIVKHSETAAVTKTGSPAIDAQLTAVNYSPARSHAPVLISGQSALSSLGIIPLPSEMIFSEAGTETSSGPSIESPLGRDKPSTTEVKSEDAPLLITARNGFSIDMLKPMSAKAVFPPNPNSGAPVAVGDNEGSAIADGNYCDQKYVGQPIRFSQMAELRLDDLLNQISSRFGVNFVVGPGVGELPLNVKAGSIPWATLLRSQLYVSGVRAKCVLGSSDTVELVLNDKVGSLEEGKFASEPLQSKYIKLKYLQPGGSGNKNVAGQSSSGGGSSNSGQGGGQTTSCQGQGGGGQSGGGQSGGTDQLPQRCKFEHLQNEIRKILGLSDTTKQADPRTLYTDSDGKQTNVSEIKDINRYRQELFIKVPGRNMFFVRGTPGQLRDIDELITRADVPPFQVVIKGLVYTANEDKLKDIGVQTSITGTGNTGTNGGIFGHTLGTLGTLFDFSTVIGTFDFNVQASALQRDGVISIKSRPFATVLDGDTTDLTVGRQVPVLIQAINPIGGAPGTLQILQAANLLSVTPYVIDDEQGNPTAVKLELQLESNDVDASVASQGVPAISVRSIQSNFILNQEQTAILGGFTVDSDSKTISKTPGLGDIPIIGELFKRRVRAAQINRLYFAVSVSVIRYGEVIEPVKVPGATTNPPTLTPKLLERSNAAEPKQVVETR